MMKRRLPLILLTIVLFSGAIAFAQPVTFTYTGTSQTWTVPSGITRISVDAIGATGGYNADWPSGYVASEGGNGGRVQCTLSVTPGQILHINIGGGGGNGVMATAGTGGYNGGANGAVGYGTYAAGGGGGASDIQVSPYGPGNRVIVAGGGGGAGLNYPGSNMELGGAGGGLIGGNGYSGGLNTGDGGGYGGTQSTGGAGGIYEFASDTGSAGTGGNGGAGAISTASGGGGGGYYGGGGGGYWAGGGGGSSYTDAILATSVIHTQAYNTATNGSITITVPNTAPTFNNGASQIFSVCQNSGAYDITSLLHVSDVDTDQTETWTISAIPDNGTLSGFSTPDTAGSGSTSITPGNIVTYTPAIGFSGTETFAIQISDGSVTSVTTFTVTVGALPVISAGNDTSICNGSGIALNATGGSAYSWLPAAGLSCTTCASPVASPTATTTYTVTGSVVSTISYNQAFTYGVSGGASTPQGMAWTSFISSLVSSNVYTGFTIKGSNDPVGLTCTDATIAQNIAYALLNGTYYSGTSDGHTWYASSPSYGTEISVDYVTGYCLIPGYDIRPMINAAEWGGINTATCYGPSQTMELDFYVAGSGCSNKATVTVTVNPVPSVTLSDTMQTVCANTNTAEVDFSGTVSGTTYAWTNNNTAIGTGANGAGDSVASFTTTNSGASAITGIFTVTPTANGCSGVAQTFAMTVNPTPTATVTPTAQSVCNNANTTEVDFSGAVAGTTFTWINDNTAIGIGASDSANFIGSFTATNSGANPISGDFTVTPAANNCTGTAQTFTITVNPTPGVAVSDTLQTVCNNTITSAIGFSSMVTGTTFVWANNNTTIGTGASGSGDSIASFTATNSGTTPVSAVFTVTPTANGCNGPAQTFTITVNPTPAETVTPTSQGVCTNANTSVINFTSNIPGTTFSWTNNNTTIGIGASGTDSAIASFTGTNSGTTPISGIFTVTPTANSCAGATQTFTVTVNPLPVISAGADVTICSDSTTVLNATGGGAYSWLPAAGLSCTTCASPVASPTATTTYTVTGTAVSTIIYNQAFTNSVSGGATTPQGIAWTSFISSLVSTNVYTGFTIKGSNDSVGLTCTDATIAQNIAYALLNGTDYNGTSDGHTWYASSACVGGAELSVDYPACSCAYPGYDIRPLLGNENWGGINTNTCSGPSQTMELDFYVAGSGCSNTATVTVTVNPVPSVTVSDTMQTVCANTNTAEVDFSSTVSGTTFVWTNSNTAIGISASGAGDSLASFTATSSGAGAITGILTVTPTANSCAGAAQTFTMTVNPTPTATITPTAQSVCNNANTTEVDFSGAVAGTTFTWINDNTAIGIGASDSANFIGSFTATNSGANPISGDFTVTPAANNCTGTAQTFTITVNPTPGVAVSDTLQTVCNNTITSAIGFASAVTGTTFVWANNNTTIGIGASGSGDSIASFTVTNSGTTPVSAVFTVTPTANGCNGPAQTFTITVNPTPAETVTPTSQSVCNNAGTIAVNFTSGVSGTTFAWTNSNTTIGKGASGTGSSIASFTATNSSSSPASGTFTVTPTANSCGGATHTFTITVNPTPVETVTPTSQAVCNNANTNAVNFTSGVGGTTFAWANSNTTIGKGASGTGSSIAPFTATNSGTSPAISIFTVTPTANSCAGATQTFTITVNPTPVESVTPTSQSVCNNAGTSAVNFTSGVSGTTFAWTNSNTTIGKGASGTGSSIASFTATNSGASPISGIFTVTPTANSCAGAEATFTITVNPTPIMMVSPISQTVCNNIATSDVSFTSDVTGTTYTWTNDNTDIGTDASGAGSSIASFTGTNTGDTLISGLFVVIPTANSCAGAADTFTINVNPTPAIMANIYTQSVCNKAATSAITFSSNVSITTYDWSNSNPAIGLSLTGSGDILSFTATNTSALASIAIITVTPTAATCIGASITDTIVVNSTPLLTSDTTLTPVCDSTLVSYTPAATTSDMSFAWSRAAVAGISNVALSGTGSVNEYLDNTTGAQISVTYAYTLQDTATGCTNTQNVTVIVNPRPVLTNAFASSLICDSNALSYIPTTNITGTTTAYNWSRAVVAGISNPSKTGTGSISDTLINMTENPVIATYVYTLTANGCANVQILNITVEPKPALSNTITPDTICDLGTVIFTAASTTDSVSFAWTRAATAGISNVAESGAASINESLNNVSANLLTVTYVYTLTINGCSNTQRIPVGVEASPILTSAVTDTICDSTLFAYTFTSATTGLSYAWSRAAVAGISNTSGNGTGNINEALYNTTYQPVIVTYLDTLTIAGTSCYNTETTSVTVNPSSVLTSTSTAAAICDSAIFSYAPADSNFTAATFTWLRPSVAGIAEPTNSGSGSVSEQLVNTTASDKTVTYYYTTTAFGCTANNPQEVSVIVHADPLLVPTVPDTVCSNVAFVYVPASQTPGVSYTWSRGAVTGISNAATSGTDSVQETLTNTTPNLVNVVYVYTLSITGSNCRNVQDVNVTVDSQISIPVITTESSVTLCSGTLYQNFGVLNPAPAGQEYVWSATNADLYATGNDGQYVLVNFKTPGTAVVYLSYSVTATGCPGTNTSYSVTVGTSIADTATVVYEEQRLVCLDNTVDSYQWGYDDINTLDSFAYQGYNAQFMSMPILDPAKLYWVITTKGGCAQKNYYIMPAPGVHKGVNPGGNPVVTTTQATDVIIYPNPATEELNISVTSTATGDVDIEVLNLLGQKLLTTETINSKAKINVAALPAGTYLVNFYRGGVRISAAKFVKN